MKYKTSYSILFCYVMLCYVMYYVFIKTSHKLKILDYDIGMDSIEKECVGL